MSDILNREMNVKHEGPSGPSVVFGATKNVDRPRNDGRLIPAIGLDVSRRTHVGIPEDMYAATLIDFYLDDKHHAFATALHSPEQIEAAFLLEHIRRRLQKREPNPIIQDLLREKSPKALEVLSAMDNHDLGQELDKILETGVDNAGAYALMIRKRLYGLVDLMELASGSDDGHDLDADTSGGGDGDGGGGGRKAGPKPIGDDEDPEAPVVLTIEEAAELEASGVSIPRFTP